MLLRAVVQVPLEASSLLVLGPNQALTRSLRSPSRGLKVGCEADVLKNQAGLVREVFKAFSSIGVRRGRVVCSRSMRPAAPLVSYRHRPRWRRETPASFPPESKGAHPTTVKPDESPQA